MDYTKVKLLKEKLEAKRQECEQLKLKLSPETRTEIDRCHKEWQVLHAEHQSVLVAYNQEHRE